MLSKSAARAFFLLGTIGFSAVFLLRVLQFSHRGCTTGSKKG